MSTPYHMPPWEGGGRDMLRDDTESKTIEGTVVPRLCGIQLVETGDGHEKSTSQVV